MLSQRGGNGGWDLERSIARGMHSDGDGSHCQAGIWVGTLDGNCLPGWPSLASGLGVGVSNCRDGQHDGSVPLLRGGDGGRDGVLTRSYARCTHGDGGIVHYWDSVWDSPCSNPIVHWENHSSYKKLKDDPAMAEIWQTAFGKDFGGMAQRGQQNWSERHECNVCRESRWNNNDTQSRQLIHSRKPGGEKPTQEITGLPGEQSRGKSEIPRVRHDNEFTFRCFIPFQIRGTEAG